MTLTLRVADGRTIASSVARAGSFWKRFRGLMGVSRLPQGAGLYLPRTSSIHMLFMRFPIDCLFLGQSEPDGSRVVVGMRHRLPPWRGVVWYVRGAEGVIELPAGTLAAAGVKPGDRVVVEPATRE